MGPGRGEGDPVLEGQSGRKRGRRRGRGDTWERGRRDGERGMQGWGSELGGLYAGVEEGVRRDVHGNRRGEGVRKDISRDGGVSWEGCMQG